MEFYSGCEQCEEIEQMKIVIHSKAANYASNNAHLYAEEKCISKIDKSEYYFDFYMFYYRATYVQYYNRHKAKLTMDLDKELDEKYKNHHGLCLFHSDKVGLLF